MHANSRPVSSRQTGPHDRLEEVVRRHAGHPFRKPFTDYNRAAYAGLLAAWGGRVPLILDTCCGVGQSSLQLAARHPDHFVVGIDQSLDRLQRGKPAAVPDNCLLLRADMVDIWRLLAADGIRPAQQWMLYPNPWPKPEHLQRRWHGHAVFPTVLALGGRLTLRTNWQLYAMEHAQAVQWLTGLTAEVQPYQPQGEFMTLFEQKYHASGHPLWEVALTLPG